MDSERFFEKLAAETDARESCADRAPARLKSQIYSALLTHLAATGPLLRLSATRDGGRPLCIFEAVLSAVPVGQRIDSMNPCRVCHARILAEHLDSAPIFWPHCPYAQFHRR